MSGPLGCHPVDGFQKGKHSQAESIKVFMLAKVGQKWSESGKGLAKVKQKCHFLLNSVKQLWRLQVQQKQRDFQSLNFASLLLDFCLFQRIFTQDSKTKIKSEVENETFEICATSRAVSQNSAKSGTFSSLLPSPFHFHFTFIFHFHSTFAPLLPA